LKNYYIDNFYEVYYYFWIFSIFHSSTSLKLYVPRVGIFFKKIRKTPRLNNFIASMLHKCVYLLKYKCTVWNFKLYVPRINNIYCCLCVIAVYGPPVFAENNNDDSHEPSCEKHKTTENVGTLCYALHIIIY